MLSPPYWIFAENFPKAGRIGKSFLVLLGCPSGRYYLGTTGLLPSRRHFEKREDPGDEVGISTLARGFPDRHFERGEGPGDEVEEIFKPRNFGSDVIVT